MNRQLAVLDLGRQDYLDTLALQRDLRLQLIAGNIVSDVLVVVEHPPVYTLGRRTQLSSVPLPVPLLQSFGADVVEVERGGDVTWHGPGQLVGYPILDLRRHRTDLHWYLRTLEQALIGALARIGIDSRRIAGKTGVWTDSRKIASIGIHVKRWVTLHGFALNVDPDLAWFDRIVPCGISDVRMTSVAAELGGNRDQWWQPVSDSVVASLAAEFELTPVGASDELLELANRPRLAQPSPHG